MSFIKACNEIHKRLEGFKSIQNGQRLVKKTQDKDISFEIYFQSSTQNDKAHIIMLPHLEIYSKTLKKWQIENTKNSHSKGLVFVDQIGNLSPHNEFTSWNVAAPHTDESINDIIQCLDKYILPIFEIFSTRETAIRFLVQNGTKFNTWARASLNPLDFLLCFSEKEKAELFLNWFINQSSNQKEIINLYTILKDENAIDLRFSEFPGARKIKLAYLNGLKIYTPK